jgi:hypothetical protein
MRPINWDYIFDLEIWQYVKWVYMAIVIIGLVFFIYQSNAYKAQRDKAVQEQESTVSAINELLFMQVGTDKKLIKLLQEYIDGKSRGDTTSD